MHFVTVLKVLLLWFEFRYDSLRFDIEIYIRFCNTIVFQEFLLLEELVPISTQSNLAQHEEVVLIKNASARFNSKENIDVLRDVNLKILPGKSYAIVGPIGSGKVSINIFYTVVH